MAEKSPGSPRPQVAAVFQEGKLKLTKGAAVERLKELTGRKKTPCYDALKADGKFAEHLTEEDGLMAWIP
jgi:hypothetical protein